MKSLVGQVIRGVVVLTVLATLAACSGSGESAQPGGGGFQPPKTATMIVPFSAGGGVDLAGRTVADILQNDGIVETRIDVENVEGGSGLVGMTRLKGMQGSDNAMMVTGAHIVSTPLLTADSGVQYSDFTPLAIIYNEYVYFFVKPDSPIKDIADFAARLKADPASVRVGGSVPGGASHLGFAKFAQAVGVDPTAVTYVPYDGDEAMAGVLGGAVDVVTAGPEGMDLVNGGELRALAVSSAEPLSGRDEGVPTWAGAGTKESFDNFRIVSGPPDMPEEAVAYWQDALTKMNETDKWKTALEKNGWAPAFQTDGLEDYLTKESAEYKQLLTDLGVINK